jgi:integrase
LFICSGKTDNKEEMKREKLVRLPILCDAGGDLTKNWFVEFYCRNPKNGKFERQKIYKGINKLHTVSERRKAGQEICNIYTDKIRNGWSPYIDDLVIYDDNLQFQSAIKNYRKAKSKNGTFNYFSSRFLDHIKESVDPEGTLPTYRSKLRCFNAWLESHNLHDVDISCIDQAVLYDFFSYIINDLKRSAITIKKYRQILSAVFDFVKRDKLRKLYVNPCFDLPTTKRINDQKPQPIQKFDIEPFKEAIRQTDPQLWLAICFEYYCFLRPGKEVRLLRIGDIDFGRGVIRVSPVNSKTVERHIPIPIQFLKLIREEYKLHTFSRLFYVFGKGGVPGTQSLSKNILRYRFTRIRKNLNMPEMYKFYSWKHTGNVHAKLAGIPLREIQYQNGHTSMLTTEKYMKNNFGIENTYLINNFPAI